MRIGSAVGKSASKHGLGDSAVQSSGQFARRSRFPWGGTEHLVCDKTVGFRYSFATETGAVVSEDPVAQDITFSLLSLTVSFKGDSFDYLPRGPAYTHFGPWSRVHGDPFSFHPEASYVSFFVSAHPGMSCWPEGSLQSPFTGNARGGGVSFSSDYAMSQRVDVQVNVYAIPSAPFGHNVPLGAFEGGITFREYEPAVVPQPSRVLGGLAAASLIGAFFVRRVAGRRSPTSIA